MTGADLARAWAPFGGASAVGGRAELAAAAQRIIDSGLWCVLEVCLDVPAQDWERRLVILRREGAGVADAVEQWVRDSPGHDVRLSGCGRRELRLDPAAPIHLCYLATVREPAR